MLLNQTRQARHRAVFVVARLEWVHRVCGQQLARVVYHRHFHACAYAWVQTQSHQAASGRCQQQIFQIARKHRNRGGIALGFDAVKRIQLQRQKQFRSPSEAHRVFEPFVGRALLVGNAVMRGNGLLKLARLGNRRVIGLIDNFQSQHTLIAPAQQSQAAVRRQAAQGFLVFEIVLEFFACLLLPCHHFAADFAHLPQALTQLPQQNRVFGKLLHQNRARAIQSRFAVGNVVLGIQVFGRFGFGVGIRRLPQGFGQRFQTCFARNLRLGAAFRFVRQIHIFQRGFVVYRFDLRRQFRRELALLVYAFEDGGFAVD